MNKDCPYEADVISMREKIERQRLKIDSLEAKYDLLTLEQIKEEATKSGMLKGMKIAATVIGYTAVAAMVTLVAHIMGFAEFIARILKM